MTLKMQQHSKNRQVGNAMTEFAVLAIVLVPAFALLPMLGKVANMNHTAIQASRYTAWEMTVAKNKTEGQLTFEVENRFFADADILLDDKQKFAGATTSNPLWSVAAGKTNNSNVNSGNSNSSTKSNVNYNLFTSGAKNLIVSIDSRGLDDKVGKALESGVKAMGTLSSVIPNSKWDLEMEGLYSAVVKANVGNNQYFSSSRKTGKACDKSDKKSVFACVERNNVILVDSWGSKDAEQVAERTRSLVPFGILQPLSKFISQLSVLPMLGDLKGLKGITGDGAFGEVLPDILPPDRYGAP
jgi:Flp pilus assembly protein TadG